jgi:predicted enzyme related to lactoylglutathione lyase
MHGQFCWYELTTPDVEASTAFYPRFTGWGTQAFDNDYTMFTTGSIPTAGIFRLSEQMAQQGVPPNWMPYVEATSVDETAKKAASLGGTVIVGPQDIPGTGRFAVLQDPQGATFGIYKSANVSGGWDGKPVVGCFSWHELMTTDHGKAFEFYRALFGWNKSGEMDMGGGAMYLMYGQGDAMYGGMFTAPPEMAGMHPFWLVYIHVDDVGKAVDEATKAGAFVQRPRMEIPGGTIAILGDPEGAAFALHDTKSMPSASPAAATVAKAGTALKKAVSTAVKAVKRTVKKVKKVKKAPARKKAKAKVKAKTKAAVTRRAKAKRPVRRRAKAKRPVARKAKTKRVARKVKAKGRTRPKARRVTRKAPARKRRRTTRAKARRR